MQEIAVASARWRLRFWCWRNVLVLSLATVAGGDAVLAIFEGNPPHTIDALTTALRQL